MTICAKGTFLKFLFIFKMNICYQRLFSALTRPKTRLLLTNIASYRIVS